MRLPYQIKRERWSIGNAAFQSGKALYLFTLQGLNGAELVQSGPHASPVPPAKLMAIQARLNSAAVLDGGLL
jgi:hypothetical protein